MYKFYSEENFNDIWGTDDFVWIILPKQVVAEEENVAHHEERVFVDNEDGNVLQNKVIQALLEKIKSRSGVKA